MKLDEFTKQIDEAMGFVQKLDYQKKSKGKDTKMSQSVNSPRDLDKAVKMFVKGAQKKINDHYKKEFSNLKPDVLEVKKGKRYYKIISKHQSDTDYKGILDSGAVWAFVDAKEGHTMGDILKPASFRAPAKHARGSVFDGSWGVNAVSPYGPAYLKVGRR